MSDAQRQDRIAAFERKIRHLIQEAVDGVRRQVEARLDEQSQSLLRLTEHLQVQLPERVVEEGDLAALAPEPAPVSAGDDLLAAARELDRARTQEEIATALIEGARRFASRAALFLLRQGEVRGWRGTGFDGAARDLDGVVFGPAAPGGWEAAVEGRGWARLEPNHCGHLCSRLEVPLPREGLLVPLVLRDRVAGALYADCLDDGDPLDAASLQTLTYLAALSLETLSVRERLGTPTLWAPEEAPPDLEPLPLWVAPPAAEPTPPAPAPEAAPVETAGAGLPSSEVGPEEPPPAIPRDTVKLESRPAVEEHAAADYWRLEGEPAAPELEETRDERLVDVGAEPEEWGPPEEAEGPVGVEAVPAEPAEDLDSTRPGAVGAPPRVEEIEEPEEEEEAPPAEEPAPRPAPAAPPPRTTTEVAPPPDMTGRGRAVARSADESPAHEEAKRLARLLVSEIKLYNEEEVQEGRRKGDLYQRLKDDIDRSREMYEERIDPEVRSSEDYFHRELVRILADGNEETLGIPGAE